MSLWDTFFRLLPVEDSVRALPITPEVKHQLNNVTEVMYTKQANLSRSNLCRIFLELDSVKDFVWERLHTGHWSQVDPGWTHAFALVNLYKVGITCLITDDLQSSQSEQQLYIDVIPDLVKMCDVGILMGAPLTGNSSDNPLDHLAQAFSKRYSSFRKSLEPALKKARPSKEGDLMIEIPDAVKTRCPEVKALPSREDLDIETFLLEHKAPKIPVLIKGEMSDWPALDPESGRKWSTDRIEEVAGLRLVPVELGSRYTDDQWTQTLMSISEFIQNYVKRKPDKKEGEKGYLAQHDLLDQVHELKEDVYTPELCYTAESEDAEDVKINAWFGPAGTVSPLHHDPRHNLFGQVFGRKYFRLYHEQESPKLYPFPDTTMITNTSRVDLERAAEADVRNQYPEFARARGWEVVMQPGDMLYIPPKCWHFVKALDESCSVNFWFD